MPAHVQTYTNKATLAAKPRTVIILLALSTLPYMHKATKQNINWGSHLGVHGAKTPRDSSVVKLTLFTPSTQRTVSPHDKKRLHTYMCYGHLSYHMCCTTWCTCIYDRR